MVLPKSAKVTLTVEQIDVLTVQEVKKGYYLALDSIRGIISDGIKAVDIADDCPTATLDLLKSIDAKFHGKKVAKKAKKKVSKKK